MDTGPAQMACLPAAAFRLACQATRGSTWLAIFDGRGSTWLRRFSTWPQEQTIWSNIYVDFTIAYWGALTTAFVVVYSATSI